jgi:hypothetical protein
VNIDRTRVLIAGELRTLGNFAGAGKLLDQVLLTQDESTRADALSERARLRQAQNRPLEALVDLREADAIYAAPQARLQSHRLEFGAGAGAAGRRSRRLGRHGRRYRRGHGASHPRQVRQSGDARTLPGRELRALRSAHRGVDLARDAFGSHGQLARIPHRGDDSRSLADRPARTRGGRSMP